MTMAAPRQADRLDSNCGTQLLDFRRLRLGFSNRVLLASASEKISSLPSSTTGSGARTC